MSQERSENIVEFIREQDGAPERELKSILKEKLFGIENIERAYLVLAKYNLGSRHSVVLGLRTKQGSDIKSAIKIIGVIFSNMFGKGQYLDIISLSEDQEIHLMAVCRPFFVRHP